MMTLRSSPKVSVLLIESKQTIKAFDLTPYAFSFIKKKKENISTLKKEYHQWLCPYLLAGRQKLEHPSCFQGSPDRCSLQMPLSEPRTVSRPHREEVEVTLLSGAASISSFAVSLAAAVQARMLS